MKFFIFEMALIALLFVIPLIWKTRPATLEEIRWLAFKEDLRVGKKSHAHYTIYGQRFRCEYVIQQISGAGSGIITLNIKINNQRGILMAVFQKGTLITWRSQKEWRSRISKIPDLREKQLLGSIFEKMRDVVGTANQNDQ